MHAGDFMFSVVIPTRNRRALLEKAVDSALAQSERRLEVIVVDEASSDGTADYLAGLCARDPRVRVLRNDPPRGGGGARNAGVELARAPWVAFLDDDDEWFPDKLAAQRDLLASHPEAVASSASFEQHFADGRTRLFEVATAPSLDDLLYENVLGGASVCVCARQVLREIGGFDPRLPSAQDYDLWIRLRERGPIVSVPRPLVRYREHDGLRITTQGRAPYVGSRRLYIKHRGLMNARARRRHLAFLCSLRSREAGRPLRARLHSLCLALGHSRGRARLSYAVHGAWALLRRNP